MELAVETAEGGLGRPSADSRRIEEEGDSPRGTDVGGCGNESVSGQPASVEDPSSLPKAGLLGRPSRVGSPRVLEEVGFSS